MLVLIGAVAGIFLYSTIHYLSLRYQPSQQGYADIDNAMFLPKYSSVTILIVVALSVLCTAISFEYFGITITAAGALFYSYTLIVLSFVDIRTQILPNIITKPLIALGLLQGGFGIFTTFQESVIGAVFGYGLFWGVNTVFRLIRKKEGMGYGDFKLLAAIGAWCGIGQLPLVVLSSSLIGICGVLLAAMVLQRSLSQAAPFGPSLALAGIISLYFGDNIMTHYLSLFQ